MQFLPSIFMLLGLAACHSAGNQFEVIQVGEVEAVIGTATGDEADPSGYPVEYEGYDGNMMDLELGLPSDFFSEEELEGTLAPDEEAPDDLMAEPDSDSTPIDVPPVSTETVPEEDEEKPSQPPAGDEDEGEDKGKGDKETGQENMDSVTINSDFQAKGSLSPTVYYQPLIVENSKTCKASQRRNLLGKNGKALTKVCPKTFASCTLQGSCRISQNGKTRSFNIWDRKKGAHLFFEVGENQCKFGYGVQSICLDPFYTVAADLKYYKPGDVIYVPALRGRLLPNGERHTGFMIVRDKGAGIKGAHRFDFFSGALNWNDSRNPFAQARLSDKKSRFRYFHVRGSTAKKVLQKRAYPHFPQTRH